MRKFASFGHTRPTLKRKLFGYMLLITAILLSALASGLFLMGTFNSTQKNIASTLELQMEVFKKDMISYWEDVAVMSIDLSEDMTDILEEYLSENEVSFSMLTDSPKRLSDIQDTMIDPAVQQLRQSDCSGLFILLDATVNSSLEYSDISRSGLYLQKNGNDLPDTEILLYRGISEIGKLHGVMPHRKWRLEFRTDNFPDFELHMTNASLPLEESYCLTDMFTIPGTSEHAVMITVPMIGKNGELYGLCGFEVNKSYFKSYHAQPTNLSHFVCLLATEKDDTIDADTGFSCGIANGYYVAPKGSLSIKELGEGLILLSGNTNSYVGIVDDISISCNNEYHKIAVMIPKADYDHAILKSNLQMLILILLLLFFATVCCLYFSRKFLSPILKALEQLKSNRRLDKKIHIPEIDDLFAYLAEQDRQKEELMTTLVTEKQNAVNEKEQLLSRYEKVQNDYETAQAEISRLAFSRNQEMDPQDYQNFLEGIENLTPTERKIFEYYLSGKKVKEILEISSIKESTLRYHNQNIYSKLGVHSLKQLLRYASLMQQENNKQ